MLQEAAGLLVVSQRTFKQVERAVVFVVDQVLEIVFERDAQLVTVVILPHFEFAVLVGLVKRLEGEFVRVPVLRAPCIVQKLPLMITGCSFFSYFYTNSSTDSVWASRR